jgi:hypothetical protein
VKRADGLAMIEVEEFERIHIRSDEKRGQDKLFPAAKAKALFRF